MQNERNTENINGFVDVCIHQARNIPNIRIYQNQDVYAKIYLTDKPELKLSTKVINGGGKNPVFNETLRLNGPTMKSSLRCEVWMLSRMKNYLQDQLLGFLQLPLSDVGNMAKEFELSSSELLHSPAGFVELSFNNTEKSPLEFVKSVGGSDICCEVDRIEFPDEEIVRENERMVSEYLRLSSVETDDDGVQITPSESSVGVEESEQNVVREEIVDMYMRGMQQFTDALAKINLPSGEEKVEVSKVFYGSRAFF